MKTNSWNVHTSRIVSINIKLLSLLTDFVCYKFCLFDNYKPSTPTLLPPLFLMNNIKMDGIQTKIK